ncbi:MAG: glycosyltransferase family 4 protein [Candidatus Niyogibacteria bacterium]|nr:glycosyltransferase family 4 protein [Candidatus Niyogibacteria bacterium]
MIKPSGARPKILVFSTVYLPMIGGAELAIHEIAKLLCDRYDFILFTARMSSAFPARERIGGVEVRRLGFGFSFDKYLVPFLGYWNARRLMRASSLQPPASRILMWGMMASYATIAAYFLKRRNRAIPFLLTLQEGDPEEYLFHGRWGLMGWWFKKIVRSADRIQTISFYLRRVAEKAGALSDRVDVVPNGVDVGRFGKAHPEARKEFYGRFELPPNAKIVITASRLVPKNGVDTLIRALALPPKNHREHAMIAGTGFQETSLKALARELEIEKRVHFLGDLDHDELARWYSAAHVFARPSRSEGLGSAFLEAMAAGLPAIGTAVGGIPDFLKHNETGVLVKVDDPHDLAYQLRHLFYDADFRARVAETGRALARDHYSWDGVANKMNGIFYRLIGA